MVQLPITVTPLEGPELFVGIVGPLGTDLGAVCDELARELAGVGYKSEIVRMSALLKSVPTFERDLGRELWFEDERIAAFQTAGDEFRRRARTGAALAHLAVAFIRDLRRERGSRDRALARTAYIFNSLKHPDEVKELRRVYGSQFVSISFYQPRTQRIEALRQRIERSRQGFGGDWRDCATKLVENDAKAEDREYGQNVGDAFPLADLFARADARGELSTDVRRLVRVLFAEPFCTPTRDEYCMFLARAAALRSADLSRQVGAVIANTRGDVVASGCNEVPRPTGGNYWPDDEPDRRDFRLGKDPNAVRKRELVEEMIGVLVRNDWLDAEHRARGAAELAAEAMRDELFEGSRVDNLIEFGRVVHAEMNALMDAVRRGVSVAGHTLYCTTFPCHLCARHIIAAGINRVVFIEPYPKSLVKELYGEAVAIESEPADPSAVTFEPFVGVAPRAYMALFGRGKRKDTAGYAASWSQAHAQPQLKAYYASYLDIEDRLCDSLVKAAPSLGLPTEQLALPGLELPARGDGDDDEG